MEIMHFDAFWYRVTSSTLNKPNILIGSQSTIEDLPFLLLIPRMNSCTFVLHRLILCHPSDAKHPCRHLRVKILIIFSLLFVSWYERLNCLQHMCLIRLYLIQRAYSSSFLVFQLISSTFLSALLVRSLGNTTTCHHGQRIWASNVLLQLIKLHQNDEQGLLCNEI